MRLLEGRGAFVAVSQLSNVRIAEPLSIAVRLLPAGFGDTFATRPVVGKVGQSLRVAEAFRLSAAAPGAAPRELSLELRAGAGPASAVLAAVSVDFARENLRESSNGKTLFIKAKRDFVLPANRTAAATVSFAIFFVPRLPLFRRTYSNASLDSVEESAAPPAAAAARLEFAGFEGCRLPPGTVVTAEARTLSGDLTFAEAQAEKGTRVICDANGTLSAPCSLDVAPLARTSLETVSVTLKSVNGGRAAVLGEFDVDLRAVADMTPRPGGTFTAIFPLTVGGVRTRITPQFEPRETRLFRAAIVTVHEARDLACADLLSKSDPYVIVRCGKQSETKQTAVVANSQNPVWEQRFEVPLAGGALDKLTFEVWDQDPLKRDDSLGVCHVRSALLAGLSPPQYSGWRPLRGKKDGALCTGQLRVTVTLE